MGDAKRSHPVRIEHDLVLLDHASDTRHFRDAGNGLELVSQEPVLNASQARQIMSAGAVDKGIFVNPPHARRIRTERARNTLGQAILDLVEVFEHTRPRPVKVGTILENDVDVAVTEHRVAAYGLCSGHRQHGRRHRVGHLVLDYPGRLARIVGSDDNLDIGQIGQSIDRSCADGP